MASSTRWSAPAATRSDHYCCANSVMVTCSFNRRIFLLQQEFHIPNPLITRLPSPLTTCSFFENFPLSSSSTFLSCPAPSLYCTLSSKRPTSLQITGKSTTPAQNSRNFQIEKSDGGVEVGSKLVQRKKRPFKWGKILSVPKKLRSVILLNLITIVYASDISVVKEVETWMDPAAFSAVRFVTSAIPFLPFMFWARDDVQTRKAGIELGLWVSLAYIIEALGLLTSDAGRASFISLFTVIVVPLIDGMLGAIIPARTWFGVLMSALGIAMLECSGSPPCVGDLLNFVSAIFFGIHMLRTEHISRSTKKENFLALLGYEVSVVALSSTLWVFMGRWFEGLNDSPPNQSIWTWTEIWDGMVAFPWMSALYTGVFSTGLCLWVEIAAMRNVSATETAIIYGLEPLWGSCFAWFLLGERWGIIGWIGAAMILGGSLMVQIFGSLTSDHKVNIEAEHKLLLPNQHKMQSRLSTSPVVVTTKKDARDHIKK